MIVVFLGPPGVGKGTQASRLCQLLAVPHLSTGDMLRQARGAGTPLGRSVAEFLDQGRLVPDEVVVSVVQQRLWQPDCRTGCLFDGFPRTLVQAQALEEMLAAEGHRIDRVLELTLAEDQLVARMLQRAQRENRADDTPDTIQRRLNVYREQTAPLVAHYAAACLLRTVDGGGTPEEVFARITACVGQGIAG